MSKKSNVLKILVLVWVGSISLMGCEQTSETHHSHNIDAPINPEQLLVLAQDLSVHFALKNDSLYQEIEKHMIKEEGVSQREAEEMVQYMIDKNLVLPPILSYYDEGGRQSKTFSYSEFKGYIKIIKDSVKNQTKYQLETTRSSDGI